MLHGLIDFLFPPQCAACCALGNGLCETCAPAAPLLHRRLPTLTVCALASYDGACRRAVLALKDGRRDVGSALGARLSVWIVAGTILVPVPTTRARRRTRGIDGVELMARAAALHARARVATVLEPIGTDAQRGRNRAERVAARGRFRCDASLVRGRTVVLIDDVCTTGATLEDCASVLRLAGGSVSHALVVAVAREERVAKVPDL